MGFFWTVSATVVLLAITWRFLGSYMAAVFDGRINYLRWLERLIYRLLAVDPEQEQSWQRYAGALVVFSGVAILVTYTCMRIQQHIGINPQHQLDVKPALSFNTAVSFVTNTNWQNYSGESTMSFFTLMVALTVQQFVSASVGIAVAIAMVRGFVRKDCATIGNFWADLVRCILYIMVPISFLFGILWVAQGAVDTLGASVHVKNALTGFTQSIARGPMGFIEPIKQLGTNGGGPFNANGAHPYENPTPLTNLLSLVLVLAIPFALTYTFGKMAGKIREGVALLGAMVLIFSVWAGIAAYAEQRPNPAVARGAAVTHTVVRQKAGNMEGKEVRNGASASSLYNIASTQTSTGSVDSANDSFNPMGGFALLTGMMLGEVTPGGAGSGLYTILLMAVIAVFIGGLMIGRTPEYLGKKIQAREVKLAAIGVLVMPVTVLIMTAIAVSIHAGRVGALNAGPHGFTEILYAFTSQANNNGSAFAGLNGNTAFYNVMGAIAMLMGRFAVMIPCLALGGTLAAKGSVPAGLGTFRTDTPMFSGLVVGVIVIIGGLSFFPAVSLGPIVEQLSTGKFF